MANPRGIEFRVPTRVCIEPGCVGRLPRVAQDLGARSVLFVTDGGLAELEPTRAALEALRHAGLEVGLFTEVETNPRTTTAERIAERAAQHQLVIGFGGGSVLDAAKAAAMLASNQGGALDFVGKNRFTAPPLPFIAVPTTCGTGSEVTWVSVLTDRDSATKVSIKGDGMFPDVALVDADLVAGLPRQLVAQTGLDALTHALEATTGRRRNPATDAMAEASIELTFRYLGRAVADIASDAAAREGVVRAATLAGMAFSNADVGGVHCLSETLGGLGDVPHGLANAILLEPVLRYHLRHVEARLIELGPRIDPEVMGFTGVSILARIGALVVELGIPAFSSLGFTPDDYPRIAAGAVANGSNDSNPQPMGEADYLQILQGLR
jgi:alcohol dehydrogenase